MRCVSVFQHQFFINKFKIFCDNKDLLKEQKTIDLYIMDKFEKWAKHEGQNKIFSPFSLKKRCQLDKLELMDSFSYDLSSMDEGEGNWNKVIVVRSEKTELQNINQAQNLFHLKWITTEPS